MTLTGSSDVVQYSKLECLRIKSLIKLTGEQVFSGVEPVNVGSKWLLGRNYGRCGNVGGTAAGDTLLMCLTWCSFVMDSRTGTQRTCSQGGSTVGLTDRGRAEAKQAGRLLAEISDLDLVVVHTSVLTRAVQTANLLLDELGKS